MGFLKSIIARVELDGSGFEKGFKGIQKTVNDGGKAISSDFKRAIAGAFSAAAVYEGAKAITHYAHELHVLSQETGANVEDLQVWEFQAKKVGKTLDDVAGMMGKLKVAREKALDEGSDGKTARNFQRLGIDYDQLIKGNASSLFKDVQRNVAALGDTTQVANDIIKVFGKEAFKSNAIFQTSFEASEEAARKLGAVVDKELIGRINSGMKMLKENMVSNRGPLSQVADWALREINFIDLALKNAASYIAKFGESKQTKSKVDDQMTGYLVKYITTYYSDQVGGVSDEERAEINRKNAERQGVKTDLKARLDETRTKYATKDLTDAEKENELLMQRLRIQRELSYLAGVGGHDAAVMRLSRLNELAVADGEISLLEKKRAKLVEETNAKAANKERDNMLQGVSQDDKQRLFNAALAKLAAETGGSADVQAARRMRMAELQGQLLDSEKKDRGATYTADSLTKMGGFVGGAENIMASIAKENLQANRLTAKHTEALVNYFTTLDPSLIYK